jgi:hypothetical protein
MTLISRRLKLTCLLLAQVYPCVASFGQSLNVTDGDTTLFLDPAPSNNVKGFINQIAYGKSVESRWFSQETGSSQWRWQMELNSANKLTLFSATPNAAVITLDPGGAGNPAAIRVNTFRVLTEGSANQGIALGQGVAIDTTVGGQVAVGHYNSISNAMPNNPYLFIVGNGSSGSPSNALTVSKSAGVAIGPFSLASGNASLASGRSEASGDESVATGYDSKATGLRAVALGSGVRASGVVSVALGNGAVASGTYAFAAGYGATALKVHAFAFGNGSIADGDVSFAAGASRAKAKYSTTFGQDTEAKSYNQTVIGRYNLVSGDSTATEPTTTDDLFTIGNGTSTARSNAFTVKGNGDVRALGVIRVKAAGDISMGAFQPVSPPSGKYHDPNSP